MSIVVTGVKGQLGYDVVKELHKRGYNQILGVDIKDLDITDNKAVEYFMAKHKPNTIIHCAAYTSVDNAEENEEVCMKVNVFGTRNLIKQAKKYNSKFIYISTDYVFDGDKKGYYEVDDKPNPQSVYGKSKYLGELETKKYENHFIVRISWVFGKNGQNFVRTILRLGQEKTFLNVVSDQFGSPTYTHDLSRLLVDFIESDKYGTYHATNEGSCSWFEFAKEIFRLTNIPIPINSITTKDYPTKAKRPMNSLMSKSILVENRFKKLPTWQDALKRYLIEIEVI
jgi:dTDP-4-dehydrorhamnose reductase